MAVPPELRARVGTPETLTGSLVTTVTVTFVPDLIEPPPEVMPLPVNATEVIDGALVSILIAVGIVASGLILPAASIWRTRTLFAVYCPAAKVKELLVPGFQLAPAFTEYCQEAPVFKPDTFTNPLLVTPSVEELPVSDAKVKLGAAMVLIEIASMA